MSSIKSLALYIYNFLLKRTEGFDKQIFLFGVIFFFNYPIYYIIWAYIAVQGYENLPLRIFSSLVALPLIFVRYWPERITQYLPLYWYFSVTFCLPFFFTFMTLMNQASVGWLLNLSLALLLIFILLDFISLCFIVLIGTGAAFLCFAYTSPVPLSFHPGSINLAGTLATLIAALVIGGIFSRNKEIIISEKMRTKSELGNKIKTEFIANISHDIRTPITGMLGLIQAILNTVKRYEEGERPCAIQDPLLKHYWHTRHHMLQSIGQDSALLMASTNELLSFFNEVLEVMCLESGRTQQATVAFNLASLVSPA